MSRIYFHSPSDTVEVWGRERASMNLYISDLFILALGISDYASTDDPITRIVEPTHYSLRDSRFPHSLKTALGVASSGTVLVVDGTPVDVFSAQLNTALDVGSDVVKLCARIHGQCEIHAYVEGAHRQWLADIVEEGLQVGIFRPDMGWNGVASFLRARSDEPVVTSYSVCDQFPNPHVAEWKPPVQDREENWDAWYELPEETRWKLAMDGLRTESSLEMNPASLGSIRFGVPAWNGFKLRIKANELAQCAKETNGGS
jgi:hypothetical protein